MTTLEKKIERIGFLLVAIEFVILVFLICHRYESVRQMHGHSYQAEK